MGLKVEGNLKSQGDLVNEEGVDSRTQLVDGNEEEGVV